MVFSLPNSKYSGGSLIYIFWLSKFTHSKLNTAQFYTHKQCQMHWKMCFALIHPHKRKFFFILLNLQSELGLLQVLCQLSSLKKYKKEYRLSFFNVVDQRFKIQYIDK